MSTLLPLSRGAVGGVPTTGSGTAAMGGGDLGVWSERGEFGVCREWGELGVSAVWGSGDGGNRLDSMGEVLEAPPFADFMSRRAFKDLASSIRVAKSIIDAAPDKPSNKG